METTPATRCPGATLPAQPVATARGERWTNPHRLLPRARWAVQLAYLAFLAWVGVEFARFFALAAGEGPITAARPPAVEGFLPIAALVGLKRFLLTRYWDEVHPAGLTIFVAAIATAFLARKAFCSWVCPVGTISRALEWVGGKLLWRRRWPAVPRALDLPLTAVKYLLLAFFLWSVAQMPAEALQGFIHSPYNAAVDGKMLLFFAHPSTFALGVLGALVALSLVVKHFWCRYLCPYGALLGVASLLSPVSVRRDPAACNDCRACSRACPAEIPVHRRLRVLSTECTGCMSCVSACRARDCLGVTRRGSRAWSPWVVPALALATMLGCWAIARASGFWETALTPEAFRMAYRLMGIG
ncbi:MAG TPA: 4Fe-4S binding protein [Anaeromyxobacter sp.]|nr:4Fe-4S binding protein [Anaeromyxobacter sp.]